MGQSNWVHFDDCEIVGATEKAIKVKYGDHEPFWVPRSQVSDGHQYDTGDENVTVSIAEWFCEKEGLEP
jgi:hypothetical protein